VWIVAGFVVAAGGGALAWVDLESADKIASVVGGVCGALGLALSAYGLLKARRPRPEPPVAAQVEAVGVGRVGNAISGSTVSGTAVQAGSVEGPVVIGERNIVGTQVVVPPVVVPKMEVVAAVPGLGRVPAGQRVFVGRAEELRRLDSVVAGTGRAVVVAVHGLGGIGKSALVARFAEVHETRFSLVWWMTADSPAAIEAGLAELAAQLVPQTVELPSEQRTELGVRWLATHTGWLLVLDNLSAPKDAAELLARVRTGTVVITSRHSVGWHALAEPVALDVLSPGEAIDLMTRIVHAVQPGADLTGVDRVCAELGWLPLAVEQAASFLAQTRISPEAYLKLLAGSPARMFVAAGESSDAQRSMGRVWHVTLAHFSDTPATVQLLRQLAWYAPDGIPRSLLTGGMEEPELSEALGRLAAYSMITLTTDTVTVHRLVQAITRTPDPTDTYRQPGDIAAARDTATTILAITLDGLDPNSPADWRVYRQVLPHGRALFDHTTPDMGALPTGQLFNELGCYLRGQGDLGTAIDYHTRATTINERLRGPDHPDTLNSRNNLAYAFESAGDLGQAIPLHEATLADYERVLGSDHPGTLNSRNNLAGAYQSAGDLQRALELHEATHADRERVLGTDHPDTLISRNNLAFAYRSAGDLQRALELHEATLADYERVLGTDHPSTLISRDNLANAYQSAGDLGRAIPLHEATLSDRERVLGSDHPGTLNSRNNLAIAYRSAGDLERAIELHEATLADYERVLGSDHPNTLNSRNNLAGAYRSAGDLGRAIELLEATLADRERVLGRDHPDTLISRNNLANAYRSAGDLDRAIQLLEATLADRERVLATDHPDTLISRNNLASAYRSAGDLDRAIQLLEATLIDFERVLGPDHPTTKVVRRNVETARDS
jgi:tetratricopeptide (TPR) repeat protein